MLLVQDVNQLLHHYGKYDSEGIKSNCFAKLYFSGSSLETSKELEQTLGQFQYEDKKKRTVVRPLMTNDEIRTMKPIGHSLYAVITVLLSSVLDLILNELCFASTVKSIPPKYEL